MCSCCWLYRSWDGRCLQALQLIPTAAPCPPSSPALPCSKLPFPHIHDSEKGLLETIWLLLASVVMVPLVCKIPGGSPVLGFLASGLEA